MLTSTFKWNNLKAFFHKILFVLVNYWTLKNKKDPKKRLFNFSSLEFFNGFFQQGKLISVQKRQITFSSHYFGSLFVETSLFAFLGTYERQISLITSKTSNSTDKPFKMNHFSVKRFEKWKVFCVFYFKIKTCLLMHEVL
jgi:hypothetical protein